MRPRAVMILGFLVLGAIVNIAVAWGFALGPPLSPGFSSGPRLVQQALPPSRGQSQGAEPGVYAHLNRSSLVLVTSVSGGWPMHALTGTFIDNERRRGVLDLPNWTGLAKTATGGNRRLPLIPLWPGFAINTVFYAAILWLLFAVPFVLRRRRRVKRGLCPKCAYPVGESAVCTECGSALRP